MRTLQNAVKQGNFDKMRSLVKKCGVERFYDVSVKQGAGHISLFHYMIQKEEFSMIRFLIEQGWDVNQKDSNGVSSVLYAMGCCNKKIKEYLLEQGLDVNMRMVGGDTALIQASLLDLIDDIKWLFLNGADPNIKGDSDRDMLYYLSGPYLKHLLPLFLQEPERWSEENLKILKAKRLQYLMR